MRRLTIEEFVKKAMLVHGDKYDYSNVKYVNNSTKISIKCEKHGVFTQTPQSHLNGKGCPKCAGERTSDRCRMTLEEFLCRAKEIHGDRYDYSKVVYVDMHTKVCIICPIHGEFWQTPQCHLRGNGCKKCSRTKNSNNLIYGVGVNDTNDDIKTSREYVLWHNMLQRCYNKSSLRKNPSYNGCSVCEEWLLFSNFKKWVLEYDGVIFDGYDLDKDILVKGNKVYGPETCCFVPHKINSILISRKSKRGKYPIGVIESSSKKGRFVAQIGHNRGYVGSFDTPEEAFVAYKYAKEEYIKEVAGEYYNKGLITKRVYDALYRWTIEIMD